MKKFALCTICFTILLLTGCMSEELVRIEIQDENYKIIIEDEALKRPLVFEGKDEGVIWFETDKGRTYLSGEYNISEDSGTDFKCSWKVEERRINLNVAKADNYISLELTAEPMEDILAWGVSLKAGEQEYFTGLFERTVDGDQTRSWEKGIQTGMDLRGEEVEMLVKPTVSLYCPFYLSSAGYGFFVQGTWPGKYDFCKSEENLVKISFEGPAFNCKIYTSADPAEIVKAHALHVGPSIVPPKWAFLPWRWRDNHVHEKEYYDGTPVTAPYNSQLVEDILMMQAFDIPCGLYWVDRPWAIGTHGYADFEWDPGRFPNAESMIGWLHSQDIRFMLWIAPWVTGEMKAVANQKGYSQPMKDTHHNVDSSNAALLDFTNRAACLWWQKEGIEKMLNQGVDGFKLDRAEETVPETREIILHDGRTAREVRNEYPVLYVKTVHESCKKIKGDDFVLIPRAGYTGSSRYSGFWGGDIGSPPEGLRAAIIALQRSSIIGFPIWGSDIGGYWQGDMDREVLARWLAFGCFNPIMEVGPTEDRGLWNMDTEPYYDAELIAIWRLYAKLHTQIAEYSHGLAMEANKTGMPIVRPLFLEYPEQSEAWTDWQSFKYGPDILVHAVWEKDVDTSQVYLPGGETWLNAWDTDQSYAGGRYVSVATPLHQIPIFIRQGSSINLGDLSNVYTESLTLAEKIPDLSQLQNNIQ